MDVFLLQAVRVELAKKLADARLVRVHQVHERKYVFTFRAYSGTEHLLVNLDPSAPRLHLSSVKGKATDQNNFCALLKNRLSGAVLVGVEQEGMERVLLLRLSRRDEVGRLMRYMLVIEVMPRVPNMILVDEAGNIIDAFKRIHVSAKGERWIAPHQPYQFPPKPSKADLLSVGWEEVEAVLSTATGEMKISPSLVKHFFGLSPAMAKEIEARAEIRGAISKPRSVKVWEGLKELVESYREGRFSPVVYLEEGGGPPVAVAPFPLDSRKGWQEMRFDSPSLALEYYYTHRGEVERKTLHLNDTRQLCQRLLKKLNTRREALLSDVSQAEETEDCRMKGDLVLANLHSIRKGMAKINLVNIFNQEQGEVEVELDPSLDGPANASHYFKRYTKLKNKGRFARQRLTKTEARIHELERLCAGLDSGEQPEGVEERLVEMGLLWVESGGNGEKGKVMPGEGGIIKHITPQGWEILVGKNSKANDYLTTRVARKDDLWLHVRGTSGAHVVVRNPSGKQEVPRAVLEKAALLAALNSKARGASKAVVDYTFKKHVRKPKGAPLGSVIIKRHKSITVYLHDL